MYNALKGFEGEATPMEQRGHLNGRRLVPGFSGTAGFSSLVFPSVTFEIRLADQAWSALKRMFAAFQPMALT